MISKMNIKKVSLRLGMASLLLTSLFLSSCKEWDDHYEAESAVEGSATATIWENISSNANLSQFATLVQKTSYDGLLKSTQTLTVWAPLNGTFNYDALMAESNENLLKEFVQNHIARNNYPAAGLMDETVSMLNEKHLLFEGNGSYTMDGIAVAQPNVASLNGVIHTLNGKLEFRSNIFESLNNKEFPIDSISDFIHSFDVLRLNQSKSTPGPVVDGRLTYLDSVFDDYNLRLELFRAYIDREDSNYTMIVPSNEAWEKAMNYIRKCYNYVNFSYYSNPSSRGTAQTTESWTFSEETPAAYWKDSISYSALLSGLFYNNNVYDNKKLKEWAVGKKPVIDSLTTILGSYFYTEDAMGLLEGTTPVQKSNGAIFVTDDTLRMHPWLFWNPLINVEAEYSSNFATIENGSSEVVRVSPSDKNEDVQGTVSNSGYRVASPAQHTSNVELNFYLPNVRSTTYVVYGVFVPANYVNRYISPDDLRPNQMQVQVGMNRANGTLMPTATTISRVDTVRDEDGNIVIDEKTGKAKTTTVSSFNNDPTKVDTVCFGEVTFPICYAGVTGSPFIRLLSRVPAGNNSFDRTIRIDRIFLIPKELDDYKKAHPDYKLEEP